MKSIKKYPKFNKTKAYDERDELGRYTTEYLNNYLTSDGSKAIIKMYLLNNNYKEIQKMIMISENPKEREKIISQVLKDLETSKKKSDILKETSSSLQNLLQEIVDVDDKFLYRAQKIYEILASEEKEKEKNETELIYIKEMLNPHGKKLEDIKYIEIGGKRIANKEAFFSLAEKSEVTNLYILKGDGWVFSKYGNFISVEPSKKIVKIKEQLNSSGCVEFDKGLKGKTLGQSSQKEMSKDRTFKDVILHRGVKESKKMKQFTKNNQREI